MKVKFVVGYRTHWGQHVYVLGKDKELGSWDADQAMKMHPGSGELWELDVDLNVNSDIEYTYIIKIL